MKNFFEWIKNNDSILESDLDRLRSDLSRNHAEKRGDSSEFEFNDEKYQAEIDEAKNIIKSPVSDDEKASQLVAMLKHSENSSVLFTNGILPYAQDNNYLLDKIKLQVPSIRKYHDGTRIRKNYDAGEM